MKSLDLNAYGVMEMNVAEMQTMNGGILLGAWGTALKVARWIIEGVAGADIAERFMDGWNSVDCDCK